MKLGGSTKHQVGQCRSPNVLKTSLPITAIVEITRKPSSKYVGPVLSLQV